jgi:hypothetical protein
MDKIADHLLPLSHASLLRALTWRTSVSSRNKNHARIWDYIFKNDKWILEVLQIKDENDREPVPCLIGSQLQKIYYGNPKGAFVALLVNDWTGDVNYLREKFFDSLRDYEVVEKDSIVRLKGSGILLHIADAIGRHNEEGWISIEDPSQLFRRKGSRLSTQAIYYNETVLHEIDQTKIGGIEGRSMKKKKAVRDICSIKLKFREGLPVYRVFISPHKMVRVVNIQSRDENGRYWVTHWRIIAQHEPEWWPIYSGLSL